MLANSCFFLLRSAYSTGLALFFLGMCWVLLPINVPSAQSQVPQDAIQPSGYLESLRYQAPFGETNVAFLEFSGSQDIDDPLEDFWGYLIDPINWDLAEPVEPRMVYRTHTGFQTGQKFLNHTSILRIGLETVMEHAQVHSLPRSKVAQVNSEYHHNLVDAFFSPYLLVESHPLSWIRLFSNVKINVLAFDVQHVCPKTCSLEPKGQENDIIASFKGGLLFGPWLKTQIFFNLGKGFYRFDEHEPIGSTAEQQINRTSFVEVGFLSNPGSHIEIRGSLWGTKNDSDFSYNMEDEEFVAQGSTQRYGVNLNTRIGLPNHTTFTGGLTVSRNTFRQSQPLIPYTPQVSGHAELHNAWTTNWSTTLQWQYLGKRSTANQSFPAFQTLDILLQYQFPETADKGPLTASLGILNVGNHRSPINLFHFDSGLTSDHTPTIDLNYFPGQPRTIVSGISLLF